MSAASPDLELPDAPLPAPGRALPTQDEQLEAAAAETSASNKIFTEEELDELFPARPKNKNPTLPFHELYTNLFDPLLANKKKRTGLALRSAKKLKPHEIRRNIIDRFISRWRAEVGKDVYPVFRLILCEKDRDRSVYHLKEKSLGRLLVKVMKISKDSEDGHALINWRQPGYTKSAGDFAGRCYEVIKKRPMRTTPGTMTITKVNELLDQLSQATKEDKQLPIMTQFYNNMCADEMMWIVRIIMRQMKVGATEKTFFDAWHPDASSLFNISSSLKRVCWELVDPSYRLDTDAKGVTLMSCFQPQLANFQKKSFQDVVKAMHPTADDDVFWIEEKLDGERMQLHYRDGEFKFWSRKAKEYTYLYGDTWETGSLTRHLRGAFHEGVKSIILDGEMITWDPKLDCIVGFGTLKTAALEGLRNPFSDGIRPLFRVFDILYLNGESLVNYTLRDRRQALEKSVKSIHRRMEIHEYSGAKEASEIEAKLRVVISEASEGLVIKNPRSIYRLNDRNDDWMKVKPEYMTEFGESLDCLVIGGYWGSGYRGSILSSYLCGLRVDGNYLNPSDSPMKFWSFFKVGGGFTANEYSKIAHMTESHWIPWDSKKPPKEFIELAGDDNQYEKPDMWIHPDKSVVLEIKAASVATTDQFRVHKTLRFPRFRRIREDKDWRSALSINEFLDLKAQVEAEKSENLKVMDVEKRRAGANKRVKREWVVMGAGSNNDKNQIVQPIGAAKAGLFEGWSFYIMSESFTGKVKKSKAEIEQLVKANGGKVFQTENAVKDICVIGDRSMQEIESLEAILIHHNVKISALKKKGTHDIIRPSWIFDCIRQNEEDKANNGRGEFVLHLEPVYMLHATEKTERRIRGSIDEYGDSFTRNVTVEELGELLEKMPGDFDRIFAGDLLSELNNDEHYSLLDYLPGCMFQRCKIYLDTPNLAIQNNLTADIDDSGTAKNVPSNTSLFITENLISFAGGKIVQDLQDPEITHIVIGEDRSRLRAIRDLIQTRKKIPRVVDARWVEESVSEKTLLDEERFAVVLE